MIPHPTSCKRFIKCGITDSQNIILECNPPTIFNPDLSFCDFAKKVNCRKYKYVKRKAMISIDLIPPVVGLIYEFFSYNQL